MTDAALRVDVADVCGYLDTIATDLDRPVAVRVAGGKR